MIAGTGRSAQLLKATFPDQSVLNLPSPEIRLGDGRLSHLGLLLQVPGLILSFFREHARVKKIVHHHHIDILISDNRYGLFCESAYTIFITHQISPVLPGIWRWFEYPLYRIIRNIIRLFNECWIPDFEDPDQNMSGKLSHRFTRPDNARFIGMLSRFCHPDVFQNISLHRHYNLALILSGPEPQITTFENLVCQQLKKLPVSAIVIKGLRGEIRQSPEIQEEKIILASHLDTGIFAEILLQADFVLCRSGYTGIMDLISLGVQAILVPTPGQSEQEYLAGHLAKKGWFQVVQQKDLDLERLLKKKTKPTLPDFQKYLRRDGPDHYLDLYGKYRKHNEQSNQKA